MAGVYRSMFVDGQKPVVGSEANKLGVRTNGHDIPIDEDGIVKLATGGMSVVPSWRHLPYFLIPRRLHVEIRPARGSNKLACFRFGQVTFQQVTINDELSLRPDSPQHGTIEPSREMTLTAFQDALVKTRESWVIDET